MLPVTMENNKHAKTRCNFLNVIFEKNYLEDKINDRIFGYMFVIRRVYTITNPAKKFDYNFVQVFFNHAF